MWWLVLVVEAAGVVILATLALRAARDVTATLQALDMLTKALRPGLVAVRHDAATTGHRRAALERRSLGEAPQ